MKYNSRIRTIVAVFLALKSTAVVDAFPPSARAPQQKATRRRSSFILGSSIHSSPRQILSKEDEEVGKVKQTLTSRRSLFQQVATGIGASIPIIISSSQSAFASSDEQEAAQGVLSRDRVAELLRVVPTFTLVDRQGVPFMVVGEDAKVTGYFFTTFDEAARILKVASDSAEQAIREAKRDQKPEANTMSNPWKQARVSTLPLDTAVSLSLKSGTGSIRNYFQVAPAASDVEDALLVTGKEDLAEGKVPLFYYEDFTMNDNNNNNESTISPVFFQKSQLEAAFQKAHPGEPLPAETKVTELFGVLTAMVQSKDEDLKGVVFVAPTDSVQRAKECRKRGGKTPPFVLGQRNIVL